MTGARKMRYSYRFDPDKPQDLIPNLPNHGIAVNPSQEPTRCVRGYKYPPGPANQQRFGHPHPVGFARIKRVGHGRLAFFRNPSFYVRPRRATFGILTIFGSVFR